MTGRQQKSFNPLAIISIDDTADKEVQVDLIEVGQCSKSIQSNTRAIILSFSSIELLTVEK